MRILIVDDERPARDKLRRMLAAEPDISAIEEARDGVEALELLPSFAPDVLLLDIQMPEITGLDVAASLPTPAPLIIFVTAYDEYAIKAFDANAIDYLLKPFDQPRLQRALQRARERLAVPRTASAPLPSVTQLLVPERNGTRIVKVEAIQWIETADNYVVLHTADGEPLMRQTLAGLLDKLGPRFIRCHRRAAVQLSWIAGITNLEKGDGELLLHGGARVPLSRQYRADVIPHLEGQHASHRH
ncbi:response regulator [Pseudoduganella sp. FT25W]|uniref:Response regulator n=1 Tax=Duganella alba TaxID=2666081 RepID=A0A6L5QH43_9BURK|nr:response regulator [Duganella alba]MRX09056.1 response regulator [Duganella alba]MRX15666.1 response regulator [Duganella alba]